MADEAAPQAEEAPTLVVAPEAAAAAEEKPAADAPPPSSAEEEDEPRDFLHIGNLVEILSTAHGYTVGRVVYRSPTMVRIMPQEASDRATEFPLDENGDFVPELGVQGAEVIEEQESDYYVDFLGVRPGEKVEFFTVEGQEAAPSGEVAEVIKSATKDNIRLTDGRTIRFRGQGPEPPIAVVRVRTGANVAAAEAPAGGEGEAAPAPGPSAAEIMALLRSVAPPTTLEYTGGARRSFPDSMQREDLFQDLIGKLSAKQRTNPRRIRFIEREVDIAVALKNKMAERDAAGNVTGTAPNTIQTFAEAIAAAGGPLPVAIPIVEAAKVLNLDAQDEHGAAHDPTQVVPRILGDVEFHSDGIAKMYAEGAVPDGMDRAFVGFAQDLLTRDQAPLEGPRPTEWKADQDIIRTADPSKPVQGMDKGLPSALDEEAPPVSLAQLATNVRDRTARVIGADRIKARRSNDELLIAPSDPSKVIGHVMLPAKAAITLRPPMQPGDLPTALLYSARLQDDNLPTVARTLRDLYAPLENIGPLVAWTMDPDTAGDAPVAGWLDLVLKYAVHPLDSLGPRTPQLLGLLDTLGLETRALSPDVKDVLDRWIAASQKQWRDLLVEERKRIKAVLDAEPERAFQGVTGDDSPAWPALREAEALKDLIGDIARRNPTIAGAPLTITSGLITEAQGDAQPLVWSTLAAVDGRDIGIDATSASSALAASRSYILRRKALRDIGLLGLRGEPEINPCEHVPRLEAIRNVRDVLNRSRLLREFVEEYQGGREGDWITCTLCTKACVCYHELMELEALAQPARMEAIMKQILVRYGGDRFEGKIICRNCGQGIQEIDYDEHVEFDDEGRAVVESSVLTAEQMEDPAETSWKKSTAALVAAPITFPTAAQQALYEILTLISERGGFTLPEAAVRMVVQYSDVYVSARTPPRAAYDAKRKQALAAASTRISTKAGIAAMPEVPTYEAWIDRLRVQAVAGLAVIALQTAAPPIVVNSSSPICKYSAEGWPLQPAKKPEEEGTTYYIGCVVASIQRDTGPWPNMRWSGEVKIEARVRAVLKELIPAMVLMLEGDPKTGPLSFTPIIRTALTEIQSNAAVAKERAIVSVRDQLPVGFRPEPFVPATPRPGIERDPVPPIESALAAGQSIADMVEPVAVAARQQAKAVVSELHTAAIAGFEALKDAKPTRVTDYVCCPVPLSAVDRDAALLGEATAPQLLKARRLLRGGIPTAVNAGTHYWEVQQVPEQQEIAQAVDAGVYFKLFLKYCYRGAQVGEVHEFSAGNKCRQCGLALGKPLDLVDFAAEGAGILAAQQGDLKVEASQAAFDALSDAVRRRKPLAAQLTSTRTPWRASLEAIIVACRSRPDLGDEDGPRAIATALEAVLAAAAGREEEAMDEVARATLWAPLTALQDELATQVGAAIGPILPAATGRAKTRSDEAMTAMAQLDKMVRDPFVEGPRVVAEYWCAKAEAAGTGFAVREVRGARWFSISREHNERLNKIMRENADWYGGEVTEAMQSPLAAVGRILGPLIRTWIRTVRTATLTGPWTAEEARALLKTIVLQAWRDAVAGDSWIYRGVGSVEAVSIAGQVANWTRALMYHYRQQFSRLDQENIAKILQQRAEMERTSVVEEFKAIKDDDERAAELLKKRLGIGRWALAAKGFREYDADMFEFEIEQRRRMGIVDAPVDPILLAGAAPAGGQDYGLGGAGGAPEAGYDANQAADGDDY